MKIWDLPSPEEEEIRLFQDKRVLPKTKQCVHGNSMTVFFFFQHKAFSEVNN